MNGMNVKDRLVSCVLGFLCCAFLPAVVAAQNAPQTSEAELRPGRVMVGLVYGVAGVDVLRTSSSDGTGGSNLQGGGLGYSGWPKLSLAVRVTDHLLLGLEGGAYWMEANGENESAHTTQKLRDVTVEPYAAWLFLNGRTRPYVRVAAGYRGSFVQSSYDSKDSDDNWSSSFRSESSGLGVSAGAGLHYFLGEHFSLGAGLEAGYQFSKGETDMADDIETRRANETTHGFHGLLSVNIAAWI